MTKPAELSRTICPRLALLIIAFVGALFGPVTRIGASEICMENPLERMVQPPRDESPCGSLGATLLAVGAVFFEDCSPNNPEVSRKYSEIVSRYAGMLPSVGLPAMAAELSTEAGKDGGRCAMRAVVREGVPFSDETREELETVLDAAFELQDISDLIKDIRATTQPQIALEKRDELKNKFQKELTERYDGTPATVGRRVCREVVDHEVVFVRRRLSVPDATGARCERDWARAMRHR